MAGLCLLAIVGMSTIFFVRNQLREHTHAELSSFARLEGERIQTQLDLTADEVQSVAADPALLDAVQRHDRDGAMRVLTQPSTLRQVAAVSIILPDGSRFGDTGADPRWAPHPIGTEVLAEAADRFRTGRGGFIAKAFAGRDGSARYQQLSAIGQQENSFAAILVVEVLLKPVEEIVAVNTSDQRTLDVHLVQRSGDAAQIITNVRFDPNSKFTMLIPLTRTSAPAVQALQEGSHLLTGVKDYRHRTVIAAVHRLPGTPWGLVVKVDQSEAYQPMSSVIGGVATAFSVSALSLLAAYLVLTRLMTARLRRITQSAVAISRGALDSRVADRSSDEIGELARAFDRMADHLASDRVRRARVEEELSVRAWHDPLTGLPNRALFIERLNAAVRSGDRRSGGVALLFCDLDEFKRVNDDFGHQAGDALLKAVAERLRAVLRGNELLARFGGDEFVVLCTGLTDPAKQAAAVAARLRAAVKEPIRVGSVDAAVSVSVGIAVAGLSSTPESMIREADDAMYRAKASQRGVPPPPPSNAMPAVGALADEARVDVASMSGPSRLAARADLRRAIDTGALMVVFQPVVDLATGTCIGYEAFTRWPREDGVAMPAEFVPLAEELGLSGSLDRWVIDAACRVITNRPGLTMSVNVSMASLSSPAMAEDVMNTIARYGIHPSTLSLEVSERDLSAHRDDAEALQAMTRLQRYGISVTLDDFGATTSNLANLHRLPIGALKLDRSLITDLVQSDRAQAMCASLVRLGGDLGLRVIAAGVEHPDQYRILRELGCVTGQGFLFGRPDVLVPTR